GYRGFRRGTSSRPCQKPYPAPRGDVKAKERPAGGASGPKGRKFESSASSLFQNAPPAQAPAIERVVTADCSEAGRGRRGGSVMSGIILTARLEPLLKAAGWSLCGRRVVHERLRRTGAEVAVAYGLDKALTQLAAWGLLRPKHFRPNHTSFSNASQRC